MATRNCPCGALAPADADTLMDGDAACPLTSGGPELEHCPYLAGYMDGKADLRDQLGLNRKP